MPKKRRLHKVTFIIGDSSRGIPPDCIGRIYRTSAYSPLQAFTYILKKINALVARDNFVDVDIETRVQVMDGRKWKNTLYLPQKDYLRLYDPDNYKRKYALEIDATQPRLFP